MGVIHHREASIKIYVPPKCGTALVTALCEYPEYDFKFYESEEEHYEPRKVNIFVVRNHFSRVLSTYYEKIVDPHGSDEDSWRRLGHDRPQVYGDRLAHCNFYNFLSTLGFAHGWDDHIAPFLTFPWFSYNWFRFAAGRQLEDNDERVVLCPTPQLDRLLPMINQILSLPPETGVARWEQNKLRFASHKIPYNSHLPPPQRYGADQWYNVELEGLYECFLDTGALPSKELMYSDMHITSFILNQIGYRKDGHTFDTLFVPGPGVMKIPEPVT